MFQKQRNEELQNLEAVLHRHPKKLKWSKSHLQKRRHPLKSLLQKKNQLQFRPRNQLLKRNLLQQNPKKRPSLLTVCEESEPEYVPKPTKRGTPKSNIKTKPAAK